MHKTSLPKIRDEELVLAALLGDLAAFDELVRRFRRAVVLVAQQVVHSRELAEDVAQEAFVLAFKALPQLEDPAKFAGWLCAIARHRARRVAAREWRSEATETSKLDQMIIAHSAEISLNPVEEVTRRAEHALILPILAQLPPELRIVLQLRYYAEWSVAQIADFLLLPATTVKWRLHQGRILARRRLTAHQEVLSHGQSRLQQYGNA